MRYASPNAVATINTIMYLSLPPLPCVYFSTRRTLPRGMNFGRRMQWPLLTLLFIFSLLPCVYFSTKRSLPTVLHFCMQTYIHPNAKKLGTPPPNRKNIFWFIVGHQVIKFVACPVQEFFSFFFPLLLLVIFMANLTQTGHELGPDLELQTNVGRYLHQKLCNVDPI